ncbi:MAG: protein kinase [Mariprofundaceae bacterium]|nr:protein kinase [Mariprofundaceae bacterium]
MKCPSCGIVYPSSKTFCLSCGDILAAADGHARLGDYVLLEKIGQGGMGIVFRAIHEPLKKEVAIKVLNPKSFGDVEQMERFRRETRMHAQLQHPNIIEFLDVYEDGGAFALVMELLKGCNLKEYLNHRGPLALPETIHISTSILAALNKAHMRDVVHRDLKPSNVFITNDGVTKLMDFGLAKTTFATEDITDSGATVGTYLYMAPEQILGQEIGVATDLYAFGITLYRMCTGSLPFTSNGGGEFEIMEKQVRQPPQHPQTLNSKIPDSLAELIMQLLAKKPEQRPASCAVVMKSLQAMGEAASPSLDNHPIEDEQLTTFSDLNASLIVPTALNLALDGDEKTLTNTISASTLLSAFSIDSPLAPDEPPYDMRKPPALSPEILKHLKTAIASIPPLPETWHRLQQVFADPESAASDLAKVISGDAVLVAHVLKMCNSAAYLPAGGKATENVAIALTRLGMDSAQDVLSQAVLPEFSPGSKSSLAVRRIWFHGQAMAMFSRIFTEYSQTVDRQSANLFGLLHDIGKLVILHIEPEEKLAVLKKNIRGGQPSLLAEWGVLGYTHIDAGMMLALHWQLPRSLHRFIYYHHFPCWHPAESWPPDMQPPIMLAHMAHLALSSLLKEEPHEGIWQDAHRSHIEGSESILYKPLQLPMRDVKLYSHLRIQLNQLKLAFPDLYPEAA